MYNCEMGGNKIKVTEQKTVVIATGELQQTYWNSFAETAATCRGLTASVLFIWR